MICLCIKRHLNVNLLINFQLRSNTFARRVQLKIDLINALSPSPPLWSLSIAGIIGNKYSTYANLALNTDFLNASNANSRSAKMFSCERCSRTYKFKKTLNRHMNHECGKDKLHSCTACAYRTHRNDRLLAHIRIVHPQIAPSPKRDKLRIGRVETIDFQSF